MKISNIANFFQLSFLLIFQTMAPPNIKEGQIKASQSQSKNRTFNPILNTTKIRHK